MTTQNDNSVKDHTATCDNNMLPAVFQSDKQWVVAQESGKAYLYTIAYSRKESIKKFMGSMDDKLKWEYFKRKYGIHCKKVTVCFQNGW